MKSLNIFEKHLDELEKDLLDFNDNWDDIKDYLNKEPSVLQAFLLGNIIREQKSSSKIAWASLIAVIITLLLTIINFFI